LLARATFAGILADSSIGSSPTMASRAGVLRKMPLHALIEPAGGAIKLSLCPKR